MKYRLVRVFPYSTADQTSLELEQALADGWQLHGSPFQGRADEYWQAVVRTTTLKEPARNG